MTTRTPEQINAEYAEQCKLLGDAHAKLASIERYIKQLHSAIESLDAEMTASLQLLKGEGK